MVLAGVLSVGTVPADQPLGKDDVTLLLLGSSPSAKIIQMVEQRGVDFQMTPELAKKFHDQGASDDLIQALRKAGEKPVMKASAPAAAPAAAASPAAASVPEAAPEVKANAPDAPEPRAAPPAPATSAASPAPAVTAPPSDSEPVLHTRDSSSPVANTVASAPSPAPASAPSTEPVLHQPAKAETVSAAPAPAQAATPALKDPSPQEIQHIIHEFAAKEKIFREARDNYTYHQINKVQELGPDNEVVGTYDQEWDILYDDKGNRIEKVTYAPLNTLKNLIVTKEDLEGFRSIQPFVLTTDELPEYDITYLGHVKVDEITAYVFRIRPKEIEKNKQYFQGEVWVDDRDLQIVKTNGKQVPQDKTHHGQENLFPRFTTWRQQVDGKFWFPTFTMADDTLYFSNAPPVHMKEIIRYTDYKQFKTGSRILSVEQIDQPAKPGATATTPPKK